MFIVVLKNGEIHSFASEVEHDKFKAVFENNINSYKDKEYIESVLQQLKEVLPDEGFKMSVEYSNCRVTEYRVFQSLGYELSDADYMINVLRLVKEGQELIEL